MSLEKPTHATVITEDGFTHKFDNNAMGQPVYEGIAVPGTATSTASWRLKKYTYDGNGAITDIQFADSNKNFDNVYDDRASKTYG